MQTILKDNRGFTLVELAIVMIIIGLLIGGTLKGQQLIDSAKVTSTISQVRNIQTGFNTFYDTYGGYPGDFEKATTRLTGCDSGSNCTDGDEDGFVESWGGGSANTTDPNAMFVPKGGTEAVQAWKHMALAGLVTGVAPTVDASTTVKYGSTHPSSSLKGGFEIYFDSELELRQGGGAATILRLSRTTVGGQGTLAGAGVEALTPAQAGVMDRKMDDGVSNTGSVFGLIDSATGNVDGSQVTTFTTSDTNACSNGGDYVEKLTSANCAMFFVLN